MTLIRIYRALLSTVAAALLALALPSCSDKGDEPQPEEQLYYAGFYLSVGEINGESNSSTHSRSEAASRAPSDGLYLPGEGVENYIDLTRNDRLRIALYDLDTNAFIAEIKGFDITPVESYDSSKRYYLKGATTADISSGRFKILVLANWPDYPAELTLDNVWAQKFDFDGSLPTKDNPIPLYGIKAVSVTGGIEPGVPVNLGTIHLLRALAKIEVIIENQTGKPWTLSKLELTNYNDKGFCAPRGIDSQNQYVTGSWNTDYVGFVSIPDDAAHPGPLKFEPADDNRYILYVPEYNNSRNDTPQAEIAINFAESLLPDRKIVIRASNAERLNFHRNVWYRVTVKKRNETSDVSVIVDVIPYAVVELDPIFGIDIPETAKR